MSLALPGARAPAQEHPRLPARWFFLDIARRFVPFVLPALILGGWELMARLQVVPAYLFPAPSAVAQELWDLAAEDDLAHHIGVSFMRLLAGFSLGAVAGTVLGGLAGYSAGLKRIWDGTLQGVRSVPIIAWVPLFVLWLGIQETSKVTLISLGAFFPVYVNVMSGIAGVDRKLVEVGRVNRMTGLRLIRAVYLPAALPTYLVGLRVGLGLSWMFVSAGELLGASQGIGYLLMQGQTKGRPELIIASIIVFATLGKVTDFIIATISRRLIAWQDTVRP